MTRRNRASRGEDGDEDDHPSNRRDHRRDQDNPPGEEAADNRGNQGDGRPGEGNNDGETEEPPPSYDESQDQQLVRISDRNGDGDDISEEEQGGVIESNLEAVRMSTVTFLKTKCHSCSTELMAGRTVGWLMSKWHEEARRHSGRRRREKCIISVADCRSCRKKTCLGCGQAPDQKPRYHKLESVHLFWCCDAGRLFAIWSVLANLDHTVLGAQEDIARPSGQDGRTGSRRPTLGRFGRQTGDERGIGYADGGRNNDTFDMFYDAGRAYPGRARPIHFRDADSKTDAKMATLFEMLVPLLPRPNKAGLPPELSGMLQLSLVLDKVAEFFRNDSLDDVVKRADVYYHVFSFVAKLSSHKDLAHFVTGPRRKKRRTAGLQAISEERADGQSTSLMELDDETSASLGDQLKNLAKQSHLVLHSANRREFGNRKGKIMLTFCHDIVALYREIQLSGPRARRKVMSKGEKWEAFHEKFALTRDDRILAPNARYAFARRASIMVRSPRGRMKRLVTEAATMATSLPPGIFVKVSESRPDIMKCLIMGPPDSPYGYGLFE